MTEKEWLKCDDPTDMMLHLRDGASDRKIRLFGCACVRRVWNDLPHERLRQATEAAERFADGLATARQLDAARKKAGRLCEGTGDIVADHGPMAVEDVCRPRAGRFTVTDSAAAVAAEARSDEGEDWDDVHAKERRAQAQLLRDVFGN